MSSELPILQFDGLASSTSLAAMSAVTTGSAIDEQQPIDREEAREAYITHLEQLLRETLEQNSSLWTKLFDSASVSQPTIPKEIFIQIYPLGRVLLRRIVAMAQHLVLQDSNFLRRPGVKVSQHNRSIVEAYAYQAVNRITRGQAINAPADQHNHGVNLYPSQIAAWATGEVLALPDVIRRSGRTFVKDDYRFRSGTNAQTHNKQIYATAMHQHTYMRNSGLISKCFRRLFMLEFFTIGFQMELIARDMPAALETLPGETPIVLWSEKTPTGTWDVVVTVVNHLIGEWRTGKWTKAKFNNNTAAICDTLHQYGLTQPAVQHILDELARWYKGALATNEIDLSALPAFINGENTE